MFTIDVHGILFCGKVGFQIGNGPRASSLDNGIGMFVDV